MANPFREFFRDLGQRLGFWNKKGELPPIAEEIITENYFNPPSSIFGGGDDSGGDSGGGGGGGMDFGFDDEVTFHPKSKINPDYHQVGSEANGPSINGIRDLFDSAQKEGAGASGFYTVIIGGDKVQGDTQSLGGDNQYRGYKMQKEDVDEYLRNAKDADDFANKIAPPNRKWTGVHTIRLADA